MNNASTSTTLTIWYKQLGHTNFTTLKTFLCHLKIPFINNSKDHICGNCNRAKATKVYNHEPQKHAQQPYQFVYTDLIELISSISFKNKQYFFIFINDCTKLTETYINNKKSN